MLASLPLQRTVTESPLGAAVAALQSMLVLRSQPDYIVWIFERA